MIAPADSDPTASDVDRDDGVHSVLELARRHLDMDVAWMSEFVGLRQVLRQVSAPLGVMAPAAGASFVQADSYCIRVVNGTLHPVVPDARREVMTRDLPATAKLRIGAYVGGPIVL